MKTHNRRISFKAHSESKATYNDVDTSMETMTFSDGDWGFIAGSNSGTASQGVREENYPSFFYRHRSPPRKETKFRDRGYVTSPDEINVKLKEFLFNDDHVRTSPLNGFSLPARTTNQTVAPIKSGNLLRRIGLKLRECVTPYNQTRSPPKNEVPLGCLACPADGNTIGQAHDADRLKIRPESGFRFVERSDEGSFRRSNNLYQQYEYSTKISDITMPTNFSSNSTYN